MLDLKDIIDARALMDKISVPPEENIIVEDEEELKRIAEERKGRDAV